MGEDTNLGIVSLYMVFKTMGLNEMGGQRANMRSQREEYPTEVTEKWLETWKTKNAVSKSQEKYVCQ